MPHVWKEVLCLGRQQTRDGLVFSFAPRDIQRGHKNFQAMKVRGVPVPALWEHQDIEAADAPPGADKIAEWKRAYARYTFAHIIDSRINDRGNLDMLHDVSDPADVDRLLKVKYVSPKVYKAGYWDSRGGTYDGTTIAHVAATPTPVQYWQKPFELSESDALYLSYAPPDEPEKCPLYDSFTDWLDAIELSATDAPDEDATVAEEKPEPKKGDDAAAGGGNADLKAIVKALKDRFGAKISDKVSNWNELLIAIESNGEAAPEPDADDEPNGNPDDDAASATEPPAGGAPMMMSTLDKNPLKKKRAEKYAADERKDAAARIDAALKSGRITPQDARKLKRNSESFEMSFTDGEVTGRRWTKLLADLATAEAKPANSAWTPTGERAGINLSSTEAVAAPNGLDATRKAEEERVVAEQAELAKKYSPKQSK